MARQSPSRISGPGTRIVIVGSTAAGKTTLARQLSSLLAIPHIELDALYWGPNWTPVGTEVFRNRVAGALSADTWIVDGNYSQARDLIWPRAETLIWLDYSLPRILLRLTRRTVRRLLMREELWSGNYDRLDLVLSRDSLYLWALQTHARRRREYPEFLARPEHAHLHVLHFLTPHATRTWLRAISERRL